MMSKQQQLQEFYREKFLNYKMEESYSSPYLLDLEVQSLNTDIMIIGQETNEWWYDWKNFKNIGVDEQMKIYRNYHNEYLKHNKLFFSYSKQIINDDTVVPIFNNLFKFDLGDNSNVKNISKASTEKLSKIIEFHQGILAKEIEIIKPKIIIFFTGHNYDKLFIDPIIKKDGDYTKLYKKIDELSVDEWKCCHLDIKNFDGFENFDGIAYRTYHPMYLNRNINKFGREIVDFLKQEVRRVL